MTTNVDERTEPPDEKSRLEVEKLQLETRKLRAERRKLRREIDPSARRLEWFKAIGGFSGFVAAIIATIGLMVSTRQWSESTRLAQQQRVDERVDRLLQSLNDASPETRFLTVATLDSFARNEDDKRHVAQIAATLANTLAVEQAILVRQELLVTLHHLGGVMTPRDREATVATLITADRMLKLSFAPGAATPADDPQTRAAAVGMAIADLVRQGAHPRDLSDTFFRDADFHDVDLQSTLFVNANLHHVSFSNATLTGANFSRATLDIVDFMRADLEHASFDNLPLAGGVASFNCTDLRNAGFRDTAVLRPVNAKTPRTDTLAFEKADLAGVDFNVAFVETKDQNGVVFEPIERADQLTLAAADVSHFRGSNYAHAIMPRHLTEQIDRVVLMTSHAPHLEPACEPRHPFTP